MYSLIVYSLYPWTYECAGLLLCYLSEKRVYIPFGSATLCCVKYFVSHYVSRDVAYVCIKSTYLTQYTCVGNIMGWYASATPQIGLEEVVLPHNVINSTIGPPLRMQQITQLMLRSVIWGFVLYLHSLVRVGFICGKIGLSTPLKWFSVKVQLTYVRKSAKYEIPNDRKLRNCIEPLMWSFHYFSLHFLHIFSREKNT